MGVYDNCHSWLFMNILRQMCVFWILFPPKMRDEICNDRKVYIID